MTWTFPIGRSLATPSMPNHRVNFVHAPYILRILSILTDV